MAGAGGRVGAGSPNYGQTFLRAARKTTLEGLEGLDILGTVVCSVAGRAREDAARRNVKVSAKAKSYWHSLSRNPMNPSNVNKMSMRFFHSALMGFR